MGPEDKMVLTFCDMSNEPEFKHPQCECGKLAPKHVEFESEASRRSGKAALVDIQCLECFAKDVIKQSKRKKK